MPSAAFEVKTLFGASDRSWAAIEFVWLLSFPSVGYTTYIAVTGQACGDPMTPVVSAGAGPEVQDAVDRVVTAVAVFETLQPKIVAHDEDTCAVVVTVSVPETVTPNEADVVQMDALSVSHEVGSEE